MDFLSNGKGQQVEDSYWRKIPGFPDFSITEYGEVRKDSKTRSGFPMQIISMAILRGYCIVNLTDSNGKSRRKTMHTLIAAAFLGERPKNYHVCHNDGNPGNHHRSNLRYDTASANTSDKIKHGTMPYGTRAKSAKLSEENIPKIIKLLATQKYTQNEIGNMFSVSQRTIWHIATGKKWKHITQGSESPRSGRGARKLTDYQVLEIRTRFMNGESRHSLAMAYNICYSNVCLIIKETSRKILSLDQTLVGSQA